MAGCSTGGPDSSASAPPTPIARLDTAALSIPRIDFCSLIPDAALRAAVGTKRLRASDWGNGATATVGVGKQRVRDVVAERGCLWTSRRDGSRRASAWTFARPVGRQYARRVVHQAAREPGCHRADGPEFGHPSLTQVCRLGSAKRVRVRHAGLFGHTWLTCQVGAGASVAAATRLADHWCVSVASALNPNR